MRQANRLPLSVQPIEGDLHIALAPLCSEDSLLVGGRFERVQSLQVLAETDELRLVFTQLLDAESVPTGEDDLLLVETLEVMRA